MMKEKLFYLLPLLALASCGEPSYKDASLSPERRAALLVKELTLEEKAHLMMDGSRSVERLGIKPYNWWNEALHGVARAGLATVFPQPIGMAASFNPEMCTKCSMPCRMRHVRRIPTTHLRIAVNAIRV